MAFKYHPTGSMLLVRRAPRRPMTAQDPIDIGPYKGTIMAMGPEVAAAGGVRALIGSLPGSRPLYAVVGDDVVFSSYQLLESRPGADLLLVRLDDIQALVNDHRDEEK